MKLLVRYDEIGLKSSQVRAEYERHLRRNLQHKLDATDLDGHILERDDRIFAEVEEERAAGAALVLSQVPGVVSVSPVVECSLDMEDIVATGVSVFDDEYSTDSEADTFAVNARRAGDHDYTSQDIQDRLGAAINEGYDVTVELDDPDITVTVEARYTATYIYTRLVEGVGGLPVNEDNRVAVLMRDRAATVAAFLLMKRGCTVYPVYTGHDPEALERDMDILRQFDPDVKLTVLKGADDRSALEQVCDLYDIAAAAIPYTAEEIDTVEPPYIDAELLFPVCGMDQEEVLSLYGEIDHTELTG
jgi:thiamine biosynthesis protein ThiI